MNDDHTQFQEAIRERFLQLPKVVQHAIVSADVSQHMRELAQKHSLHLDQWENLENEVQLTLLGVHPSEDLAKNIQSEVGVPTEVAAALADDISKTVFEPIRQELERQLESPNAVAKATSGVEDMRANILADVAENRPVASSQKPVDTEDVPATGSPQPTAIEDSVPATSYKPQATGSVAPATPPAPPPTMKAERAPATPPSYVSAPSHERKTIEGDPYREQIE